MKQEKGKVPAKKDAAKSLQDLFEDCLKDALWAENAVKEALPKMVKNASTKDLKTALQDHLEETKNQIKVLKDVFKSIGVKPEEEKCDAMQGILEEEEDILESTKPGSVRDAGIIAACQKVEHYEIASYETMISFSNTLEHKEATKLLKSILKEEKNASSTLSTIGKTIVFEKANK